MSINRDSHLPIGVKPAEPPKLIGVRNGRYVYLGLPQDAPEWFYTSGELTVDSDTSDDDVKPDAIVGG